MYSSPKQEQLRQLLKEQYASLQQSFPSDRQHALLALIRASNKHYLETQHHNTSYHGLQRALSLCFSAENTQVNTSTNTLDTWADSTLQTCTRLAEVERMLDYCDSGFMRMQQGRDADYSVWVASKKMPTEWREREDLVWLTNFLKQTLAPEMHALLTEKVHIQQQLADFATQWNGQASTLYQTTQTIDDYYHHLGILHVKSMPAYTTYPNSTRIGGCPFAVYRDVLGVLIGLVLKHVDICNDRFITPSSATESPVGTDLSRPRRQPRGQEDVINRSLPNDTLLIEALATTLALDRATVRLALDAYTLDAENVSYHASTTEVPGPPLIRLDEHHRVVSLEGLPIHSFFLRVS